MGVVYKARQKTLNRIVALKMLRDGALAGRDHLARFRDEAETLARLHHPNVVQIYEVGEWEGRPYFTFEFADGGSLAQKLKGTPQPPREAAGLVETLARAMAAAHQCGIVHRDLKPSNILLTADGGLKIGDFGLAKRLEKETAHTLSGAVLGTPSYMAPEQARGDPRDVGPATDIYALGALLYELLTGRPPFKAATNYEIVDQVIHREPIPPRQLQAKVPRDLETICLKCLQKQPRQRYGFAGELADDLRRFLDNRPILARPIRPMERVLKWTRRHPAGAALVGLSAAVLISAWVVTLYFNARLNREVREKTEQQRIATLRAEINEHRVNAEQAAAKQHWEDAAHYLAAARDKASLDPSLADLVVDIEPQLAKAQDAADTEKRNRESASAREEFSRLHDQALFHATFALGDLPADAVAMQNAAQQALAIFRVTENAQTGPVFGDGFTEAQEQLLRDQCYELLLILGDNRAQGDSDREPGAVRTRAHEALKLLQQAKEFHPLTHAYLIRRAYYLELAGDGEGSRQARYQADALKPVDALDHFLSGCSAYRRRDWDGAVTSFETLLRERPDYFWANYLLGICHFQQGRSELAIAYLTACLGTSQHLQSAHHSQWIHLVRGLAHSARQQWEEAKSDFAAVLDHEPDRWVKYAALVNEGSMYLKQEEQAFAHVDSKKSIEDYYKLARVDLRKAIAQEPDQPAAYINLAQAAEFRARAVIRDAPLETARAMAVLAPLGVVVAYPGLAECASARSWFREAGALLDEASRGKPGVPLLHRLRARIYRECNEQEAALSALERTIRFAKLKFEPWAEDAVEGAFVLYELKRPTEALIWCDSAEHAPASGADVQGRRAQILVLLASKADPADRQGLYSKAADAFNAFPEPQPAQQRADFHRLRALVYAQLNDYPAAVLDLSEALDIQPSTELWTLRGWAFLTLHDPRRALADFEEALKIDPAYADAHNGRGFARARLAQTLAKLRAATGDADSAILLNPDDPQNMYKAARIYFQAAHQLKAERALRKLAATEQLRTDYEKRALALTRRSILLKPYAERSKFWQTLQTDDVWEDDVRARAEFRLLDKEFPAFRENQRPPSEQRKIP
jgi:tRNA A-37 threonylcarbamoyl transferase component Bud32/lipoprotein NlpI